MAGNTTTNTEPAIRALVHTQDMLDVLKDGFLPDGLHNDIGEFMDGTEIQMSTSGDIEVFDLIENQPTPVTTLDTGKISLTITNHVGNTTTISDELKDDSFQAAIIESRLVPNSLRAIKELYETDLLATAVSSKNGIFTLGDTNNIAGQDHRWIANGTNQTITIEDFIQAKLSFDKASVPDEGRLFICDPIVEATLNNLTQLVNVSNNARFEGMVTTGFSKGRMFVRNIFGFDIWVSNRLPQIATESISGSAIGAASITNGVNNIFLSVASDQHKPFMGALRVPPKVEGSRNASLRRDEFHVRSKWGFAPQKGETLISVITSALVYK